MIRLEVRKIPPPLFSIIFAATLGVSCVQTTKQTVSQNQVGDQDTSVSTTPPFQTKEPARYRAHRITTLITRAGESVTNELVAKDEDKRRTEWSTPALGTIVYLELANGRFLVVPQSRIYADLTNEKEGSEFTGEESAQLEDSPERLLHADSIKTRYQEIGNETLNGRRCNKFRVVVNTDIVGVVSNIETTVWLDDTLGMILKTETTSAGGTRSTIELSDISLDADPQLWVIPQDYARVDAQIIRQRMRTTGR